MTVARTAIGTCAALCACGEESGPAATTSLTARDFAATPAPAAAPQPVAVAKAPRSEHHGQVEATGGIDDVRVLVGAPVSPAPSGGVAKITPEPAAAPHPAAPIGAAAGGQMVDSLVGQINGRPVFASDFFAPMDARLRAEARTARSREDWFTRKDGARDQIRGALIGLLKDELLLAEFEAALSPEQRLGVLAFVEDLRGNITSLSEGSRELANRRLLETEGVTLEEKVKLQRDNELIHAQINKVLSDRTYVAWREVVQEYERDYAKYHPGATARLRVIQAPLRDETRLNRIHAAVDAGEDWAAIASRDGAFKQKEGGLYEVPVSADGYSKTTFYSGAELNSAAQALDVGKSAQVDFAGSRFWMRLEAIDQPPGTSLYTAQLDILNNIYAGRLNEEEIKYFDQLLSRQSATELSQMTARLERLAIERYAPYLINVPQRAPGGALAPAPVQPQPTPPVAPPPTPGG